jgi:hypothetical protein
MHYRSSTALLLACAVTASVVQAAGVSADRAASDNVPGLSQFAYRQDVAGFALDRTGAVRPVASDNMPAAVVNSKAVGESSGVKTYVYDTREGVKRISLIDQKQAPVQSAMQAGRGSFTVQNVYGASQWVPNGSWIDDGWAVINGDTTSPWIQIMYLYGAPYGTALRLNYRYLVPGGWVKSQPGWGTNYSMFTSVTGAPPGTIIWADSYFPIPTNWVRLAPGPGFNQFRNAEGMPSGTVWNVDVSWGFPSDWSFFGPRGYPMSRIRKN